MLEDTGFELIRGKGNQVIFDDGCPKCGSQIKTSAWLEFNSFLAHIQCPLCGYDKETATRLAEEGLSEMDADIEIRRNLFSMAPDEYKSVCKKCGYITLDSDQFPTSCSKCGSSDVTHSLREGNAAMLMWLMKNHRLV